MSLVQNVLSMKNKTKLDKLLFKITRKEKEFV